METNTNPPISMIPIDKLEIDPIANMRPNEKKDVKDEEVKTIIESIRVNGLQVPLDVRPKSDGTGYLICAGGHRFYACQILVSEISPLEATRLGINPTRCRVHYNLSNKDAYNMSIIENQKATVTFYQKLDSIKRGITLYSNSPLNLKEFAGTHGLKLDVMKNYIKITELPYPVLILAKELKELTETDRQIVIGEMGRVPHMPNAIVLPKCYFVKLAELNSLKTYRGIAESKICTQEDIIKLAYCITRLKIRNEDFLKFCKKSMQSDSYTNALDVWYQFRNDYYSFNGTKLIALNFDITKDQYEKLERESTTKIININRLINEICKSALIDHIEKE